MIRSAPVLISTACLIVSVAIILILEIDLSAYRHIRGDVVVRDAHPEESIPLDRFRDQSPFTVWIPSDLFVRDAVLRGELPLWEPLQGTGYSPVLTAYNGVFHPLRWVMVGVPRAAVPSVFILTVLWLSFLGMILLLRHESMQLSWGAAIAGSLIFVGTGPFLSHLHFSGGVLPLAHLPWITLVILELGRRPNGRKITWLTLLLASLILSGHPSLSAGVLGATLLVSILVTLVARSAEPLRSNLVALLLALGLTAFATLPVVLGAGDMWSYKTETPEGSAYSAMSWGRWMYALEYLWMDGYAGGCCLDGPSFYYYFGIPAIVLIVVGMVAMVRRKWWPVIPAVLFFMIAFPGPWMGPLEESFPLRFFKPWYLAGQMAFFFGFAGATGMDRLNEASHGRVFRALLGVALGGVALFNLAEVLKPERLREPVQGVVIERLREADQRTVSLHGQTHSPNISRITNVENIRLTGPMFSKRYSGWWETVDSQAENNAYPTTRLTDRITPAELAELGVAFVIQSRLPVLGTYDLVTGGTLDSTLSPQIVEPEFVPFLRSGSVDVRTHGETPHPRAHFADGWYRVAGLAEAIEMVPQAREEGLVVVEGSGLPAPTGPAIGSVRASYPEMRKVVLEIESATGGLVVLHDAYAEGWTAHLDGRDVEIFPVNVLSRGVFVPAGVHRVEMSFMPEGMVTGFAISLVSLVAMLWLSILNPVFGGDMRQPLSPKRDLRN